MLRSILIIIIVNLIIFSGLPGVYADQESFLCPQLQIQTINMNYAYQEGCRSLQFIPNPEIPIQENIEYTAFLKKLIEQVGSAEELMDSIKKKYAAKYGQAIANLEAKEAERPGEYKWVVKHEEEVMLIAYCMGKVLGLRGEHLAKLAIGCRFHDIGKCDIDPGIIADDRVFSDKKLFSPQQREIIRDQIAEHSVKSYDILKDSGINDELILSVVFYHHANIDGSGYPDPITRQYIPLGAKIARVADSFSAMLGTRPYNQRFKHTFESAVEDISDNSYVLYGPRVVRSFLTLAETGEVSNRHKQLYYIPLKESCIFRNLFKQAENIPYIYPFAKVACGISRESRSVRRLIQSVPIVMLR